MTSRERGKYYERRKRQFLLMCPTCKELLEVVPINPQDPDSKLQQACPACGLTRRFDQEISIGRETKKWLSWTRFSTKHRKNLAGF